MYLRTSAVKFPVRPKADCRIQAQPGRGGQRHGRTDHEKEDRQGQSKHYQQVSDRRQHALQDRAYCVVTSSTVVLVSEPSVADRSSLACSEALVI